VVAEILTVATDQASEIHRADIEFVVAMDLIVVGEPRRPPIGPPQVATPTAYR
jgi:hypothetical protein